MVSIVATNRFLTVSAKVPYGIQIWHIDVKSHGNVPHGKVI